MRLSTQLNNAFNEQVLKEYHNQMIYKQIESWFEDQQLHRIAIFFHEQANDEKSHASKFINYINSRSGGKVTMGNIGRIIFPDITINGVSDIAKIFIEAEEATTESIEAIYELAQSENSFMDLPFILKFLHKQVCEEAEADLFASQLQAVKDLVLFDKTFKVKK